MASQQIIFYELLKYDVGDSLSVETSVTVTVKVLKSWWYE